MHCFNAHWWRGGEYEWRTENTEGLNTGAVPVSNLRRGSDLVNMAHPLETHFLGFMSASRVQQSPTAAGHVDPGPAVN
jgi:hypothetical protein